jgi:hypothetical protein
MLKRGTILILAVLLTAQAPMPKEQPTPVAAAGVEIVRTKPDALAIAEDHSARNDWWTQAGAVFTGLLFLVSAIQAALFVWQLRKISEQAKLARDEFSATHRPKIRVRLLRVKPLQIGKPVEIDYVIANIGENDAVKVQSELTLTVVTDDSKEKSWTHQFRTDDVITGGCVIPTHVTDAVVASDWGEVLKNPTGKIRVLGTITYEEKTGTRRKTGFYRECAGGLDRFNRCGTEDIQRDYEYED